jgi:hypothetical protein
MPDWVVYIIVAIITSIVVSVIMLALIPEIDNATPSGTEDFQIPDNSESRVVPVIYGTVLVAGNAIYFGGLRQTNIEE